MVLVVTHTCSKRVLIQFADALQLGRTSLSGQDVSGIGAGVLPASHLCIRTSALCHALLEYSFHAHVLIPEIDFTCVPGPSGLIKIMGPHSTGLDLKGWPSNVHFDRVIYML